MLFYTFAIACTGDKWLDDMVARGDLILTFKPNGDLSGVKCNHEKYTTLQCASAGEYVFDYYANKKKG